MSRDVHNQKVPIVVISTGGTIEKTYDEGDGSLLNRRSVIKKRLLERLRFPYTELRVFPILAKDSLGMTDYDRDLLATTIENHFVDQHPIVVLHGTDTMVLSAEFCQQKFPCPPVPIIFTGSMKPLGLEDSDARQNVTEALLAAKILAPGIYISFHNRIFSVPGVQKDKRKRTFYSV